MKSSEITNRKAEQLGMNPGTASVRLVRDMLFKLMADSDLDTCNICREKLTRDTFSLGHNKPWLDSGDAIDLFFDLSNVSFRHKNCNSGASRNPSEMPNPIQRPVGCDSEDSLLPQEDIDYIRRSFTSGSRDLGARALGRKFNVSHVTILDIVNMRSYF